MENVFNYYEFTSFFKDTSDVFLGNEICFSELNDTHFLIFENNSDQYNLYVARYNHKKEIGVQKPEILELLVENYDKDIPSHRIALRQYFE